MRERTGTSWWNLAHIEPWMNSSAHLSFEGFVHQWLDMVNASRRVATAAGFGDNETSVYMFDETHEMELLTKAAQAAKAAFPSVPVMTTARDLSFGYEILTEIQGNLTDILRHFGIFDGYFRQAQHQC